MKSCIYEYASVESRDVNGISIRRVDVSRLKAAIRRPAIILGVAAATLAPASIATAATAATAPTIPSSSPGTAVHLQVPGVQISGPASAATVVCSESVENPHYSSGAGSVIYKARVTCNGKVSITFRGTLASGPLIGPGLPRASTTQTRTVTPGSTQTFYTPAVDGTKVPCMKSVYYQGYGDISAVNGNRVNYQTNKVAAC